MGVHSAPGTSETRPGAWHALAQPEVLSRLRTRPEGLSQAEAASRLIQMGPNIFRVVRPVSAWAVLLRQFRNVLMLLLALAGSAAALAGDAGDAIAIGCVIVLNIAIGFGTEIRAHRAMEALLALEVRQARVIRAGHTQLVNASELVPGDVIALEAGQAVPADARLLDAAELQTVEAPLTGEPEPVGKRAGDALPPETPVADRSNMVYMATGIVTGAGSGVVVATGMQTEVGRIGRLTESVTKQRTPMERRLTVLGHRLALASIIAALLVAALGALHGMPLAQVAQAAIALAVAAVPEGLPVVATIAMAIGVRRMARRHASVRHLPVVETLGSASVICADKTGTLTTGRMSATVIRTADHEIAVAEAGEQASSRFLVDGQPVDPAELPALALALRVGALANASVLSERGGAVEAPGDPTDVALLVVARQAGLERRDLLETWPLAGQLPFSSERMLTAAFHETDTGLTAFVKGSPGAILERSNRIATADGSRMLGPEEREQLMGMNRDLARRGLRVLALAMSTVTRAHEDVLHGLTWVAFAGLSDPPASGVAATIRTFREAGIRTVMITGDQRDTAARVARELGMLDDGGLVLDGAEVDAMDDVALEKMAPGVTVFGRTSPEAKLRIVAALQRRGEVVAMLGDGVNDAAALRQADIGVAMGRRGTDMAKEAADVILEDDRFATIGVVVREGRVIFDNVRKFVAYLFSCNLAEIMVLLGAGVAGHPGVLAPLQILWLNLLTDTFPALALAVEPAEPGIMRRQPVSADAGILPRDRQGFVVGYASLIAVVTLAAFAWGLRHRDAAMATAMAFMTLAFSQIGHLGNARSDRPVVAWRRVIANPFALGSALLAMGLQLLVGFWSPLRDLLKVAGLDGTAWVLVVVLALVPAVVGQALRAVRAMRPG
jgi:Ca2+-transporting ATPase